MKGIELPINILVLVAIAVIVLLGMVSLYFVGIGPFSTITATEAAKTSACRVYLNQGPVCSNAGSVSVTYPTGVSRTLQNFTEAYYGCSANDATCTRRICGCPGY